MFTHAIRLWLGNMLIRHTKIKLAFMLFTTNLVLLLGGYIDGDNWESITVWLFGSYAASNVGATYAHSRQDEVASTVEKEERQEIREEIKRQREGVS